MFVVVVLVAMAGTAAGQQTVTGCETLDTQGESYVLGDDVQNQTAETCIEVTADGVSLDGNGYSVDGVNGTGGSTGVLVRSSDNVTVENLGNVTGWGSGLAVAESINVTVSNNVVNANSGDGLLLITVRSTVRNNTANRNGGAGTLIQTSFENSLTDNTFVDNAEAGIFVESSQNNQFSENVAEGQQVGVLVRNSLGNSFEDDTSRNNDIDFLDVTDGGGDVASKAIERSSPDLNSVKRLNIGDSVKPDTKISFEAVNFAIGGVEDPHENPQAESTGRYFAAQPAYFAPSSLQEEGDIQTQQTLPALLLNVSLHYRESDVNGINESTLRLWADSFGSTNWTRLVDINTSGDEQIYDSTVDTSENTVRWRYVVETSQLALSPTSTEGDVSVNEHNTEPLTVFGAFGASECTNRRSLGRGQDVTECPSDRTLSRGESRQELNRGSGGSRRDRSRSDMSRRDRGRR